MLPLPLPQVHHLPRIPSADLLPTVSYCRTALLMPGLVCEGGLLRSGTVAWLSRQWSIVRRDLTNKQRPHCSAFLPFLQLERVVSCRRW